jgi:AcrR family transcriptional regulator
MPKILSESERAYIKARLKTETENCLATYGIRKTTIDDLVKRVGIPKGTFYLFYESKERLMFDVILAFNDEVQAQLLQEIAALTTTPSADVLSDIIFRFYLRLDDSFLPRIMQDGELEFFMRTLPAELSGLHAAHDHHAVQQMISLLPGIEPERAEVFSAALRSVFLSLLFKSEIGEDIFNETLYLLIRGIVIQMLDGNKSAEFRSKIK